MSGVGIAHEGDVCPPPPFCTKRSNNAAPPGAGSIGQKHLSCLRAG